MSDISYTYTVLEFLPEESRMTVEYQAEGKPTVRVTTPIFVGELATFEDDLAKHVAQYVPLKVWSDFVDELPPSAVETALSKVGVAATIRDPLSPPTTTEEIASAAIAKAQFDRAVKESSGLTWVEPGTGKVFYLDTTPASQSRFAAARLIVVAGERVEGGVWKCAEIVNGEPVMSFRPTSNSQIIEWSSLVHTHVQKCFEAEGITVSKIMAGDVNADYETEFAAL